MVTLTVNGQTHQVDAEPDTPLLWVLRDFLRLNGTRYGCGIAYCGACTVEVNGNAVRACIVPASAAEGSDIRTIEDLDDHPVQQAWIQHQMESAITWGLTSAMFGEILIEGGATRQKNFHEYEMVRISHMPAIETVILPPTDTPGSGGECGAPPAPPALANAIFAATGRRLRSMPFRNHGISFA